MPNITCKSCYYLFILLHEKFFVTPSVYFVTRFLIDSVQHVISCDPKSKLTTRSIANTCKDKNRRKAIFNWAAKGLFFLKGGGGYTH